MSGRPLHRGYWELCANCMRMVVHARSTRQPFHMHRRSKRCREDGEDLRALRQLAREDSATRSNSTDGGGE